jgi:serine/threonine-protein kinase
MMADGRDIPPSDLRSEMRGPRGTVRLAPAFGSPVTYEAEDTLVEPVRLNLPQLSDQALRTGPHPVKPPEETAFGSGLPNPGAAFSNWRIIERHAKGGLSLIYKVEHQTSGIRAALKLLQPYPRTRKILVDKQIAEANLMMSMRGPGFCDVYDVGVHPEYGPYFVMELLQGETLGAYMRRLAAVGARVDLLKVLDLIGHAADILHTSHLAGVVHRDIKPDNIFLERGAGERPTTSVKVIDFGIARSRFSPHTTADQNTIGTPRYAAPEMYQKGGIITGATDQFALAVILYEAAYQHPLVEAEERGLLELCDPRALFGNLEEPPRHLVPEGLWLVMRRALALVPSDRYPSMLAFEDALRSFKESRWQLAPAPAAQRKPMVPTVPAERPIQGHTPLSPRVTPEKAPTEKRTPKVEVPSVGLVERATLLVLAPPALKGKRFELGAEGVIGRHPATADVVLEHPSVSNRHLRYSYVTGGETAPVYAVEDLESRNGSAIDEIPVLSGRAIKPGALMRLGDVVMTLLPAGRVEPDGGFTSLADALAPAAPTARTSAGEDARDPIPQRALRRRVPLEVEWPAPTLLVIEPEAQRGERYELGASGTIGREIGYNDIVIGESGVSGQHVRYTLITTGPLPQDIVYLMQDLNSSNGTSIVSIRASGSARGPRAAAGSDLVQFDAFSSRPIAGWEMILLGDGACVRIAPPGSIGKRGSSFTYELPPAARRLDRDRARERSRLRRAMPWLVTVGVSAIVFISLTLLLTKLGVLR